MERVLKVSKSFVLGVCSCGCGQNIPIRRQHARLIRYQKDHNIRDIHRLRGSEAPHWKGGKVITRNGYIAIWNGKSYVLEHRLVMKEYLGRQLTTDEAVHHINGNKQDNRIENLQLFTNSEHSSYERKKDWAEGKYSRTRIKWLWLYRVI